MVRYDHQKINTKTCQDYWLNYHNVTNADYCEYKLKQITADITVDELEKISSSSGAESNILAEIAKHNFDKLIDNNKTNRSGGYIYFVQGELTKLVKIGFTLRLKNRMMTLKIFSPDMLSLLGYLRGPAALEKEVHDCLRIFRRHGEWFTEDVLAVIRPHYSILKPRSKQINYRKTMRTSYLEYIQSRHHLYHCVNCSALQLELGTNTPEDTLKELIKKSENTS